jgi:hypothetical protein
MSVGAPRWSGALAGFFRKSLGFSHILRVHRRRGRGVTPSLSRERHCGAKRQSKCPRTRRLNKIQARSTRIQHGGVKFSGGSNLARQLWNRAKRRIRRYISAIFNLVNRGLTATRRRGAKGRHGAKKAGAEKDR